MLKYLFILLIKKNKIIKLKLLNILNNYNYNKFFLIILFIKCKLFNKKN